MTVQHPIPSGFGAASTAELVSTGVDLSGKLAIVTGGYSGLGRETARVLRALGARVIVPARDVARAETAINGIVDAEVWPMDLLDPGSIKRFVDRFLSLDLPLHIVVNSAGIMAPPLTRDARGFESQFATNHLGHFQMTVGLLPALRRAGGARIVSVSSLGHRYSPVIFDDINFERRAYEPMLGYGQSKTANILFAVAFDAREKANGIRAFAVHPGSIVGTGLEKHIPRQVLIDVGYMTPEGTPILDPARNMKTVEQGAATSVWCAVNRQLDGLGGLYCENCDVAAITDSAGETAIQDGQSQGGVAAYAIDPEAADRLWAISEMMLFA